MSQRNTNQPSHITPKTPLLRELPGFHMSNINSSSVWHLQLAPAQSRKPHLSLPLPPPNPTHSESLQTKKRSQKAQFCILGDNCNVFPCCHQHPNAPPKSSAFDHTWEQTQLVVDTASPLPLQPIKSLCFSSGHNFSGISLWDHRTCPAVALLKYTCQTFSIWLDLAYCISGETYYGVGEDLLVPSKSCTP